MKERIRLTLAAFHWVKGSDEPEILAKESFSLTEGDASINIGGKELSWKRNFQVPNIRFPCYTAELEFKITFKTLAAIAYHNSKSFYVYLNGKRVRGKTKVKLPTKPQRFTIQIGNVTILASWKRIAPLKD